MSTCHWSWSANKYDIAPQSHWHTVGTTQHSTVSHICTLWYAYTYYSIECTVVLTKFYLLLDTMNVQYRTMVQSVIGTGYWIRSPVPGILSMVLYSVQYMLCCSRLPTIQISPFFIKCLESWLIGYWNSLLSQRFQEWSTSYGSLQLLKRLRKNLELAPSCVVWSW